MPWIKCDAHAHVVCTTFKCLLHLCIYEVEKKQVSSIQFLFDNWSTRIILAFYLCIFSIVIPLRVGKIQIWKTKQVSLFYRPVFFYSNQTLKNVVLFLTMKKILVLNIEQIFSHLLTKSLNEPSRTETFTSGRFKHRMWHQCRKKTLVFCVDCQINQNQNWWKRNAIDRMTKVWWI